MKPVDDDNLKPERIQTPARTVTHEDLRKVSAKIGEWTVDPTPNAIYRHFPQPSFAASVALLTKVAEKVAKHGRVPYAVIDATGVTVRFGNPPNSGVTETDLEMAAAVNAIS